MSRIDSWASKLLSYAGRLQLIKFAITIMQTYWCQVFLIPQKALKLILRACTSLLWTGSSAASRKALVAWDYLCLPKSSGGWNITCMKTWNIAAICKLLWNLAQKKDKVWVRWVHAYYIKGKDLTLLNTPPQVMGSEENI